MTDEQRALTPQQQQEMNLTAFNALPADVQSKVAETIQQAVLGNRAYVQGHVQIAADAVRGILALNTYAVSGQGQAVNHMLGVATNGDATYQTIMGAVVGAQIPQMNAAIKQILDAATAQLAGDVNRSITPEQPKKNLFGR